MKIVDIAGTQAWIDDAGKQIDDGSRNALDVFMKDRDEKLNAFLNILKAQGEYWKARVLLELLWEYENSKAEPQA